MKRFYDTKQLYKNKRFYTVVVMFLFGTVVSLLWLQSKIKNASESEGFAITVVNIINEPIQPISFYIDLNEKTVVLGEKLFHDPRLSANNRIACATCHNLQTGGVDRLPRSIGINGLEGRINAPTVFNSGLNFRQDWDGRAASLEDQIDGPTHNEHEMGSSWDQIIGKLKRDSEYVTLFDQLYPDGVTSDNIKNAIATFERSLYTPNSRFDKFLRGNNDILTADEKEGYHLFKTYGCTTCHQGVNVGGNTYQKLGLIKDYFADRGNVTEVDLGRFNVTGEEKDRHVFKVPSLRNVALTPPYFHDSSAETLEEAITVMGKYQLGHHLTPDEIAKMASFLHTLTGEYKGSSLESQIPQ